MNFKMFFCFGIIAFFGAFGLCYIALLIIDSKTAFDTALGCGIGTAIPNAFFAGLISK